MTKQEFITRQRMLEVRGWCVAAWGISFVLLLTGGTALAAYVENRVELAWMEPVLGILICVLIFGGCGYQLWWANRQQKRYGCRCPSCRKQLSGFTANVAIASGNCGSCGEAVFDERPST